MSRIIPLLLMSLGGFALAQDAPEAEEAPLEELAEEVEEAAEVAVAEASPPAPVEPALQEPVIRDLGEGLTLVVVEDHRVPLVELRVQLPAGDRDPWFQDGGGEEAWTLQAYDPEGELRARADALAVDIDLRVMNERSVMSVSCLERDLDAALRLTQDILTNTEIDADELKRTQQARDLSWKSSLKDPLFRTQQAAAFQLFAEGDPRRLPYEAPAKVVKDLDTLIETRDALLRMPGMVVGVAGDVTPERAADIAEALREDPLEGFEYTEPVYLELRERPAEVVEEMDNLTQVYMAFVREGPRWDDPDYAAWVVADHILGGHFFSRLYVALRHEGGETYGAGTFGEGAVPVEGYGAWTFTRSDNKDTTVAKLRQSLDTLYAEGIREEELADAVGYLQGRRLFARQSPGQVLDEVLWEIGDGRPRGFRDDLAAQAAELTVDEVNEVIGERWDPASFTQLMVLSPE